LQFDILLIEKSFFLVSELVKLNFTAGGPPGKNPSDAHASYGMLAH